MKVPDGLVKAETGVTSFFGPAQNSLIFCMQPETLPVFVRWLRDQNPQEDEAWFDPATIARDMEQSAVHLAALMDAGL